MIISRDLSHIDNIGDLQKEKRKALDEIASAEANLEYLLSDLPMKALGNAVGFVAGAVAKGFDGPLHKEPGPKPAEEAPPPNFSQTLRSVGEETAYFALAKLVEKLLTNR